MSFENPDNHDDGPDELPSLTPAQAGLCLLWFFTPFIALCLDALVSCHG